MQQLFFNVVHKCINASVCQQRRSCCSHNGSQTSPHTHKNTHTQFSETSNNLIDLSYFLDAALRATPGLSMVILIQVRKNKASISWTMSIKHHQLPVDHEKALIQPLPWSCWRFAAAVVAPAATLSFRNAREFSNLLAGGVWTQQNLLICKQIGTFQDSGKY